MSSVRALAVAVAAALMAVAPAHAQTTQVGTSFPADFPVILDASLGTPVLGFGSDGPVLRTPVIFLHGNNDTPYPTACNPFYGHAQRFASFFLAHGYRPAELWGLGYQGDQCDLLADQTRRSGPAHTSAASVPDLRAFVHAVLEYTGARRVDIVAHSLGGTVAREWMRQDNAYALVRTLVTVASPHHGIINCSPSPLNYWQLPAFGGFTPSSAVCVELGAVDTPFLTRLNANEAPGPTRYMTFTASDSDLVYLPVQDGVFPPVPSLDRDGDPEDFSWSPVLQRVRSNFFLAGQGVYDPVAGSAHLGIWNSPVTWAATRDFLPRFTFGR